MVRKIILDNYILYSHDNDCKMESTTDNTIIYGKWNGVNRYKLHTHAYGGEIILFPETYQINWFGSGVPITSSERGQIISVLSDDTIFSVDNECPCSTCCMKRDPNYVVLPDGSICRRDYVSFIQGLYFRM